MKKLKELLKESYVWERKFGEKLPTLASIQRKKNEGKLNEDKSLAYFQHIEADIFDAIHKLDSEMKKHSVAKKDAKIKKILKGLYKLESDLGNAINDLDVPDYNRGYDKKRFKKR